MMAEVIFRSSFCYLSMDNGSIQGYKFQLPRIECCGICSRPPATITGIACPLLFLIVASVTELGYLTMVDIAANLAQVREKIEAAADRAGRPLEEIKLVAVSKTIALPQIEKALPAGIEILGENKVQEAKAKHAAIGRQVEWHLLGHLQTNKVKDAAAIFDLIHSMDSLRLAREIDKRAAQAGKTISVLLEINLAGEETKSGISPEKLPYFLDELAPFPYISVQGLMCIPPYTEDPKDVRPYFRQLTELFHKVEACKPPQINMTYLSMGMSRDFEIAIEEGANMVRIGTAIFGPRKQKD